MCENAIIAQYANKYKRRLILGSKYFEEDVGDGVLDVCSVA